MRVRTSALLFALSLAIACEAPGDPSTPDASVDASVDAGVDAGGCPGDCEDGLFCNGVARCVDGACVDGLAPCGLGTTCDETADRCVTECEETLDADGDGVDAVDCGGDDCDDTDARRAPGLTEVCDAENLDEDCDSETFGDRDADADGYVDARCCNGGLCGDDCVDVVASIHPDEAETCNGLDDDCDAAVDEGVLTAFVIDADRDGHGSAAIDAATVSACDAPPGYAPAADDCDDAIGSIHPGAYDRCDTMAVDDDCSGTPNDPPSGCGCDDGASRGCALPGVCGRSVQLCIAGAWADCTVRPVDEVCANGEDDDCDGAVDDGCGCTEGPRFCGSDVGSCTRGLQRCAGDGEWTACVDATEPAPETCNDLDDDCDGTIDEGVEVRCFADADADGYAIPDAPMMELCAGTCPTGTTATDPTDPALRDCDPADARVHPGQTDGFGTARPDGTFDYDCDGASTPMRPVIGSCIAAPEGACLMPSGGGSRLGYDVARQCGQLATFIVCATTSISTGDECREVYRCASSSTTCSENRVPCR